MSYSLARGKAAAVTRGEWRDSGVLSGACTVLGPCCRPGQRENTETVAKLQLPSTSLARLAPRYHALNNFYIAPEGITLLYIKFALRCIRYIIIKYGNYHGRLINRQCAY